MRTAMLLLGTWSAVALGGVEAPRPFTPGERSTYEVRWLGLPAGEAQLTVGWAMEQYGRQVWPLVCEGRTVSVGRLYPVNDRFVSYWDPAEERSLGADFFVDENRQRRRENYRYDFESGEAHVTKQKPGRDATESRHAITRETVDLAAAGFGLRTRPLRVGEVREFPVFTGGKSFHMRATVEGVEELETALGALPVYRVKVNTEFNGQLATRGLMTLYYSADERQLPVRAEAEMALGTVVLSITSWAPGLDPAEEE